MAKTARRTWQQAEGRVASLFGAKRQPCSGSSGRDDLTRSDSTHQTLFIETKLRARHEARALYDDARAKAKGESKVPVLALVTKGRPGALLCVHSDDLAAFAAEVIRARAALEQRDHGQGAEAAQVTGA
jgi:hypothetical protein